jgi:UDP:flavonoid glycosyltransferase YjiC (YdhE family)
LTKAIEQALNDRVMQQRATQIGQRIRSEDGIVRAVQLIEKFVAESR